METVLLCSHLLADVEDICDRISILYGGKIRSQEQLQNFKQKSDTQLTFHNLSEQMLKELQLWLRQKDLKPTFSKPQEKLETFFLHIVEQARQEQQPTAGAEAGKTIADFFTTLEKEQIKSTSNQILDNLLLQHPEEKQKKTIKEEKNNTILQKLTQVSPKEEPVKEKQEVQQEIKRDVLNNLLQ